MFCQDRLTDPFDDLSVIPSLRGGPRWRANARRQSGNCVPVDQLARRIGGVVRVSQHWPAPWPTALAPT
jgi:hypothetical protein